MKFSNKLLRCEKGLETVTALFMLLIVFAAIMGIIIAFSNYELSIQGQMNIEEEQIKEKIAITDVDLDDTNIIANLTISNMGTTEVKIRALYRKENGITSFLTDPSTFTDTYIAQGQARKIDIKHLGITANTNTILIASTERGTRSIGVNEIELEYGEPSSDFDTSTLSIGPLMLHFDSINYTQTDKNGLPTGTWPGWPIPSGIYCSWKINITNIDPDNRDIIIDQNTGLTLSKVGSPDTTTWYLQPNQQTLTWNQTSTITFLWDTPGKDIEKISANQKGQNNIFLTFFGFYSDGITKYAQTIPFEAVTIA